MVTIICKLYTNSRIPIADLLVIFFYMSKALIIQYITKYYKSKAAAIINNYLIVHVCKVNISPEKVRHFYDEIFPSEEIFLFKYSMLALI